MEYSQKNLRTKRNKVIHRDICTQPHNTLVDQKDMIKLPITKYQNKRSKDKHMNQYTG